MEAEIVKIVFTIALTVLTVLVIIAIQELIPRFPRNENDLDAELLNLEDEIAAAEAIGDDELYNKLVDKYNALVDEYNQKA